MFKRFICLISFIVMLALAGNVTADKIDPASVTDGHVYLFDNVSDDVPDDSANSNTGTIVGDPQVVDGLGGKALHFDGDGDGIDIPDSQYINVTGGPFPNRTIIAVFRCDDVSKTTKQTIFEEGGNTRGMTFYVHDGLLYAAAWNRAEYNWDGAWLSVPVGSGEWHTVAMVIRDAGEAVEDDKFEMWLDGVLIQTAPGGQLHNHADNNAIGYTRQNNVFHDGNAGADGHYFEGAIDEVWILNQALTQVDMSQWGKPWPYPYKPDPADGAMLMDTWVSLSWMPGDLTVSHDVYFGENLDDVNDATRESDVFRGNQTGDFYVAGFPGYAYPEGLVPGTTYYWRIDEVNEADPNSPWKGDVWSFLIPPRKAYNPGPVDGLEYIDPNVTFSWTPGFQAKLHYVYFGDNFDDVNSAAGGLPTAEATYSPGTLELEKTYYWRIDEFDGAATNKGNIWSFTVRPSIPISDPDLICWWKLDEGQGTSVLDWSGHGYHATFTGQPQWVEGYDGAALNFNGFGDSVIYSLDSEETWPAYTVVLWAKANVLMQSNNSCLFSNHTTYATDTPSMQVSFDPANNYQYHGSVDVIIGPATTSWVHLAVAHGNGTAAVYYNGNLVESFSPGAGDPVFSKFAIGVNRAEDNWFDGSIDDCRIYNRMLSQEEIQLVMRIDPLLAWNASPANGATVDIDNATPLTWSPGDMASQHDVYFGADKDAVTNADSSDTTGIYRASQAGTSFTPSEGVEWGGGPYYWRVDENNTDGTVTKGRVWSFTVADFILIDDFETYDANDNQIWYAWHDGLGYGAPGVDPYFAGNGTGAAVGDENTASYTEETIVNGGGQSMPLSYDNNKQGFAKYSEAEFMLTAPRDWAKHDLDELSLWFHGQPASVGSFVEGPAGTYTMTATGTDIWGTADEFHYAFKMLTGAGSIVARVESVEQTNNWAKAGVMIRETLDAGSKFAAVYITPTNADGTSTNGCRFQARTETDASATSDTSVATAEQTAIVAPYWVKLVRDVGGNFRGYYSANGSTWQSMSWNPQFVTMGSNVYVGLALTSHDAALTCQAEFSNVTITGTAGPQWTNQDIGIESNAAEPLYVALSNAAGTPAVVYHDDANAATIDAWTEWIIPLQAFADQGINLADIDRIAIGLGTRGNMTTPGGSGKMFFDDIRLYQQRDVEDELTPVSVE